MFGGGAALRERSVFEVLSETMNVYIRHPREFLILSGAVMGPAVVLSQLFNQGGWGSYAIVALLLAIGLAAVVGAGVVAVAQHYLCGEVDVRLSYLRVQGRIVSVVAVALGLGVVMAVGAPLIVIVLPFVVALVYGVYWSFGSTVAVVEKHQLFQAFKRSRQLVTGSWWRVFGALVLLWLVAIGVGLLVAVTPAIVSNSLFGEASSSAVFIGWIAAVVAAFIAPPVIAIGYSLLYYDLRFRREDFDFDVLGRELALAPSTGLQSTDAAQGDALGYQEGGSRNQVGDVEANARRDDDQGSAG